MTLFEKLQKDSSEFIKQINSPTFKAMEKMVMSATDDIYKNARILLTLGMDTAELNDFVGEVLRKASNQHILETLIVTTICAYLENGATIEGLMELTRESIKVFEETNTEAEMIKEVTEG